MRPRCERCHRDLRWFPGTYQWGCDGCQVGYPPSAGRVRAEVSAQGAAGVATAYIGDLWLESDRVAFAATARVGGRFWGFVAAFLLGMVAGRGAARRAGKSLFHYAPSFDKAGSLVIMGGEIASVTRSGRTWDVRLVPNPRGIDRVVIRPYYAWPLEHLQSLVHNAPLPALPAPRWPRPVPSGIETIGALLGTFGFALADGLRERVQRHHDERLMVLIVGALGVLAGIHGLLSLRSTPRSARIARWLVLLIVLGLSGAAAGRAINAYVNPLPAIPEPGYRF